MTSMIQQTGLLPAGSQPWHLNMLSSCGPNFAYCATLAVYIYEYDSRHEKYKLTSINASHSKTITCISWNMFNSDLFATGGSDGKICVWNVKLRKCVASREKLNFAPICIGWIPGSSNADAMAYCGNRGATNLWNIVDDTSSSVDYTGGFDCDVTLFRWHHTDPAKFVFGHVDGSLSLYFSGKRSKHVLRGSETSTSTDDSVLALLWDPLSSDYLLAARKRSGVQLIDVKSCTIITNFVLPSKVASSSTMSWIDSAPGMFLTGDYYTGILRLWNVSNSTPLESINLKSTGFHCLLVLETPQKDAAKRKTNLPSSTLLGSRTASTSSITTRSHSVPPASVVCAFADGGIGLYDLFHRKWEFLRKQGHIETIFDCKFKPTDPRILATASFDGTVKVWSVNDLEPLHSSSENEGVIYSIAWSPGDANYIACGTRKKGLFIWDIDKSKVIRRFKEHGMFPVYCVAWTKQDSHQVASCSEDCTCVVQRMDGSVTARFMHPGPSFGCEWNNFNRDLLATGCSDGAVRIWHLHSPSQPQCVLKGHQSKVFHVRWNPLLKHILCSGSDDRTIRTWDTEKQSCLSLLEGHTAPVRGLMWNYEIPYLLASGSWDSSLRLWNVRDGKNISTVLDHGADIYGLTTHPGDPFTIATSSRDSTLRIWTLTPLTQTLYLTVLSGDTVNGIISTPEAGMLSGAPMRLAGSMSDLLTKKLPGKKNGTVDGFRLLSQLFSSSRSLNNLWDLVSVVKGQRELSKSYKDGILHGKHLTKYKASEAQAFEHSQAHKSGVGSGSRHRDDSLMHAARLHLQLGNFQRYCEILVQLGNWERALALAPAVSHSYWAGLAKRYADILENDNDNDSVTFLLATGNVREAVGRMTSHHNFQDALLAARSAKEGSFISLCDSRGENSLHASKEKNGYDDLLSVCYSELAERHYHDADPHTAASLYLSFDNVSSAIDCLVKANKLPLVLCLSKTLQIEHEGVVVAARLLALKCETEKNYDIAVGLLQNFDPAASKPDTRWGSLHSLCARCEVDNDGIKTKLHSDLGFLSPSQYKKEASSLSRIKDVVAANMMSDDQQHGFTIGIELLTRKLSDNPLWTVDNILDEFAPLFCVRTSLLRQQSNKILRTKLLAISSYIGVHLAYRREYTPIVKAMFQYAISMAGIARGFDADFPLVPSQLQDEMDAVLASSVNDDEPDVLRSFRARAGSEPLKCMIGVTIAHASDLPSHSEAYTSTITHTAISGPAYFLDDGRSVLSLNEAIMWAKCNQFSPTGSGSRLCPF